MSSYSTSESGIHAGLDSPRGQHEHIRMKKTSKKEMVFHHSLEGAIPDVLEDMNPRFKGRNRLTTPAGLKELEMFQAFISSHVQVRTIHHLPCMLLWAEWVRYSLKQVNDFPEFIGEDEFRDLIVHLFGFNVAVDADEGMYYPGIRFVPDKGTSSPEGRRIVAVA